MGNVYALALSYVDGPILRPVMHELARRGHACEWGDMTDEREIGRWGAFLDADDPRIMLTTGDMDQPGHQATTWRLRRAREAGVYSVSVLHGAIEWNMPPMLADVACVWGKYYLRYACPTRGVAVTGNPALDAAPDHETARDLVARMMGWPAPRDYILWAAISRNSKEPRLQQASIELFAAAIGEAARRLPVIMRPHPRDADLSFYESLAARAGIDIWIGDSEWCGLLELHRGAALVMGNSSVMTEAAVCGTPALFVRNDQSEIADGVVCFNWTGPESIDRAMRGRPSAAFAQWLNDGPPGQAAARVADEVEKVMEGAHEKVPS